MSDEHAEDAHEVLLSPARQNLGMYPWLTLAWESREAEWRERYELVSHAHLAAVRRMNELSELNEMLTRELAALRRGQAVQPALDATSS